MYMSDTLNLANSIWPNGMKVDSDGHAVFYPLGTNKIEVPTSSEWPKGNRLVSPYVYQDDKLVGFVDTKALTTNSQTTIYLPYTHIEAEFSAIEKGQLQIHAPNATTKKASWKKTGKEDIPEAQFKYKGCKTYIDVNTLNHDTMYNYLATLSQDSWSEPLWDLTDGYGLFSSCVNLISFTSDLPSLTSGKRMFLDCSNLPSFDSDLSTLESGYEMFAGCANLTSFSSDLTSLTAGYAMFENCHKLTTFNCDNLSSLTNGDMMFQNCYVLTAFNADLSSLNSGSGMFYQCENLTTCNCGDLSSLTEGDQMFYNCHELITFNCGDLSSLINGSSMFNNCYVLTAFNANLSSLTNGRYMFYRAGLESFASDLSSLTDGTYMFFGCENLKYIDSNIKNLTKGYCMCEFCYNLTTFTSDLSNLTNGEYMFTRCKLDAPSIKNIIDTINTYSGKLTLGIGCNNTTEDKDLFAQEVGYSDMTSLLAALQSKGWTVTAEYTGRPTTTYGLRRPSTDTLPVFVKLEETEKHADYTSLDDSKKFRLTWFHETTGSTDGYTQFNSLEEAVESLNIKPIENQ